MSEERQKSPSIIFGPVPSRRLGMSLGVDIVPMKICSYDCIYCEVGKTTTKTIERSEYVEEEAVVRALEEYFAERHEGRLDYVTFSGSGEPTLNNKIGALIRRLKELTDTPVAVLTNGSLLYRQDVQDDLLGADLVIPSLDAVDQQMFLRVNQPDASLQVTKVLWGIQQFRRLFAGEMWLEILLVKGVNDDPKHIQSLTEAALWINPTKIQLTTVVRPSGHGFAPALSDDELRQIADQFKGQVEVIGRFNRRDNPAYGENKCERIEAMLKIRPMTLDDIAATTGMHRNEVLKYLDQLRVDHIVKNEAFDGSTFYTVDRN